MDLIVRQRAIVAGAIGLSVLIGWQVAEGSLALASLCAAVALLFALTRVLRLPPDVWLTGLVLLGYLVGNRGFAQLHPPMLPLFPAEAALLVACAIGAWRWSQEQRLPFRPDGLNTAVLVWIILGVARLPLDFRAHGFVAARDFAMTYYAIFFFLAQDWARRREQVTYLTRCLVAGMVLTPLSFWAFVAWPDWIERWLVIWGAPLLYVKSDVAGSFMAGAVLFFAHRYAQRRRAGWLAAATLSLLGVATCNSRAAAVALLVGALFLVLRRQWRTLSFLAGLGAAGVAVLAAHAALTRAPLASTPLYRAYEAAASVVDFGGERSYRTAELGDKPDNNRFRMVWWSTVIDQVWEDGRWLGVGFGTDLAEEFLRIYAPDTDDQFTARSPHNFLLSVFARTGLLGLGFLLAAFLVVAKRTWRTSTAGGAFEYYLLAWAILIAACFGVVLEGPMGAVVFWTVLGLANGSRAAEPEAEDQKAGGSEVQRDQPRTE